MNDVRPGMSKLVNAALVLVFTGGSSACMSNEASAEREKSTVADPYCDGTVGLGAKALEAKCSATDKDTVTWAFSYAFILSIVDSCKQYLSASIESGRAKLDEQAVNACIAGQKAVYDGSPGLEAPAGADRWGPDCDVAIIGQQPAGAACSWNYECQTPLSCVGHTLESDGTCQEPQLGENCDVFGGLSFFDSTVHPGCASGAYCGSAADGEDTCIALKSAGESCDYDEACEAGLRCHLGQCGTASPSGIGAECVSDSDCVEGAYCSVTQLTCQALRTSGEPCSDDNECDGICQSSACQTFCGSG